MIRTRTRLCACFALLLLVCLPAAAQWADPATQLARDIAAITGPGTVTVNVHNLSSVAADEIPVIKHDLQNALRASGVTVVPTNAAADITLTLSENISGYVWVAEVRQSNDSKVAMVTAPRGQNAALPRTGSLVAIRKTAVWSQDAPMLDVAVVESGEHLIVLGADNITLYKMTRERWTPEQRFDIAPTRAFPRDVRGRLVLARDHLFDAYLPGVVCSSTAKPPLAVNCRASDAPWPISGSQSAAFGSSRNYFSGAVTPAIGKLANVSAFYSAAAIPRPRYTLWAFARADGSVHLMDGVNDIAISARDWGSDLAAVQSSCGAQTQLLVSGTGDGETPDVIRAFEIADREPVEVARPVEFAGPVTALWTAADGRSATAIVHNLNTGKYDAFDLAITCGE